MVLNTENGGFNDCIMHLTAKNLPLFILQKFIRIYRQDKIKLIIERAIVILIGWLCDGFEIDLALVCAQGGKWKSSRTHDRLGL